MTPNKQYIKSTIKTMWSKIVNHGFDIQDEIDGLEVAPEGIQGFYKELVFESFSVYQKDIDEVIEDDTTIETKIAQLTEFAVNEIREDLFEKAVEKSFIAEVEEDYMCNEYELTV